MTTGIYTIRNKRDGNVYVGSTRNSFKSRWNHHKSDLRANKHHSKYLQNAWNKYGEDAFEFQIMIECEPADCVPLEQVWINAFRPEYNSRALAESNRGLKGAKRTDDQKRKIAEAKRGSKNPMYGKKITDEQRQLRRERFSGKGNPNYGKKASDDVRAKLSAAHIGQQHKEETKKKMSEAHRGKQFSPEHRANIAAARRAYWDRKRAEKQAT